MPSGFEGAAKRERKPQMKMQSTVLEETDRTEEENDSLSVKYMRGDVGAESAAIYFPRENFRKEEPDYAVQISEPYVSYEKRGFRHGCYRFVKRSFDIVSSGLALILLSWLILLCLLIKWLEDFHSPVYVSERVGKDGKTIRFYKIRTMCVNADKMKDELIAEGKNEADGPAFKMKKDPRITRFGRVLRKLSLDELPQLLNIFGGSMSVVGPRPPLPREVAEYTEEQMHRLDVKGGLLCLWQIQKNRNAISFDEWVRLDIEYIRKQSLWLDFKIIVKGFFMVLFDRSGE